MSSTNKEVSNVENIAWEVSVGTVTKNVHFVAVLQICNSVRAYHVCNKIFIILV